MVAKKKLDKGDKIGFEGVIHFLPAFIIIIISIIIILKILK